MKHQLILIIRQQITGEIHITLHILGICDIKDAIMPVIILLCLKQTATKAEQITRCLQIRLDSDMTIIVTITEAGLHYEQILVVISQNDIIVTVILQILILESLTDPRHEDIVQVDEIKLILVNPRLRLPAIAPSGGNHLTVELGTALGIIKQRHLTGGNRLTAHLTAQKRHDESRETQTTLHTVLHEVLITIAFQSTYSLICATQLDAECL